MKLSLANTITLFAASFIGFSGQVSAQQVCKPTVIAETTPTSRFTINNDGTVTDKQTNLLWARCRQGLSGAGCTDVVGNLTYTWSAAMALTQPDSVTGGPTGWRLPNIKEIESLTEKACHSPAIKETVFPKYDSSFAKYSSSTPTSTGGEFIWSIFHESGITFTAGRTSGLAVRLVRDGQ